MSDAEQPEAVDRLVAERLRQRAEQIDAGALIDRIRSQSLSGATVPANRQATRTLGKRAAAVAAIAAGLLLAFLGGRYLEPAPASAAVVLRDVQTSYVGIDRCYLVQYAPDPRYWNPKNKLEGPSQSVLWTRGDRFWADCTIAETQLTVGQEKDGTLWVTPSRRKGIRFGNDPGTLPPDVALICSINSMSVPRLLDEVLADFDLQESPGSAEHPHLLIRATLKPGRSHRLLADVLLEIDTQNNSLTRIVLWTVRDGLPKGVVTYTLVGSAPQDDQQYLLQSRLDADAEVEVHHFKAK